MPNRRIAISKITQNEEATNEDYMVMEGDGADKKPPSLLPGN
jgi:hypothetical protein